MFVPAMNRCRLKLCCVMLAVHLAIFLGVIAYYPSSIACILFQGMDENCSMSLQGVQEEV